MKQRPVGILLAAGKSQRFNSNKLLHPIFDNTPMILVTAQKLASVLPGSVVVINPALKTLTTQLKQMGLCVVINEQAEQGMGSSISCGVSASQDVREKSSGWLIALADMPYIKTETLILLAHKLTEGAGIVAPLYKQQRGHPVGFSGAYINELLALNKDIGARNIIKKNQDQLELVLTDDEGVVRDIDYPGDVLTNGADLNYNGLN